jgi:hypothetical protein
MNKLTEIDFQRKNITIATFDGSGDGIERVGEKKKLSFNEWNFYQEKKYFFYNQMNIVHISYLQ